MDSAPVLLSKPATSSLSPTHRYPASFASHFCVSILISCIFIPPLQSLFFLWKIIAWTFSFLAKHGPELGISYLLGKCLTQLTILFIFIETWKMSIRFFFFVNCEKPTCKEETCMLAHNFGDLSSQPIGSQPMALGLCHIIWECVMEQREKGLRSHRLFKDIPQ